MTELQKVLYDYAWEYQIPGLLRASQKEAADNDRMVDAALTRLRGLGPEGADLAQRLESAHTINFFSNKHTTVFRTLQNFFRTRTA